MATSSSNSTNKKKKPTTNRVCSKSTVEKDDRISNLPEAILSQILSLLTTETAVSTSILSKRWRFLWTSITNLDFNDDHILLMDRTRKIQPPINFINYVNRILLLNNSPEIQKFSLHLHAFFDHIYVYNWISDAVIRNLRELHLRMEIDYMNEIELPNCFYYCKTLEVIKLSRGFEFKIPKAKVSAVCFPNLKILHLDSVYCGEIPVEEGLICFPLLKTLHLICVEHDKNEDIVCKLVFNCPVIEHLLIRRNERSNSSNIDMCALSLRSAELDFRYRSTGCKVQIDAPALQNLTISAWNWADEFVMKESYSLIEAKLTYAFHNTVVTADQRYNPHKLIKAVDMAQFLIVSIDYVEALKSGICVFPSFCNLTRLEMDVNCRDFSVLQCFLENSVNLQHMVIRKGSKSCGVEEKWWNEQASVPKHVLSALKSAEILLVVGCTDEVALIEYILKNAKVLERITIQNSHLQLWNGHQLLQKILSFPRASKKCEVSFS